MWMNVGQKCDLHIQRWASEASQTIWTMYYGSYNFPLEVNARQVSGNGIERPLWRNKFVYINNPQLQTTFHNNMKTDTKSLGVYISLNFDTRFSIGPFWSPVTTSHIIGISSKLHFRVSKLCPLYSSHHVTSALTICLFCQPKHCMVCTRREKDFWSPVKVGLTFVQIVFRFILGVTLTIGNK
jgi:hypothetical protein